MKTRQSLLSAAQPEPRGRRSLRLAIAALLCFGFSSARAWDPNKPFIYEMRIAFETDNWVNAYSTSTVLSKSDNTVAFRVVANSTTTDAVYQLVVTTQGNVGIATASPAGLFTVGNGTLTVLSNGNVGIGTASPATALEVNGIASAPGIRFPSTQSASSNENTLDDYEEGTWTPVMGDGTNNYTLSSSVGVYTKIGNLVTLSAHITWTSIGSAGSGWLTVTNLPFAMNSLANGRYAVALGNISGMDNGGGKQIVASGNAGGSYIYFFLINDNASYTAIAANAQSASGFVQFTMSYQTN